MKLRITAYDKDNNILFLNEEFDGDMFYYGVPNELGADYGFAKRGTPITDVQRKRMMFDRRLSSDLQYILKLTMYDHSEIKGKNKILELLDMTSDLHYGNLEEINSYFKVQCCNCRKAEKLVFEKI